jgi:hypothetical protein
LPANPDAGSDCQFRDTAAQLNDLTHDLVACDRPSDSNPVQIAPAHATVRDPHEHFVVSQVIDGNGGRDKQA